MLLSLFIVWERWDFAMINWSLENSIFNEEKKKMFILNDEKILMIMYAVGV